MSEIVWQRIHDCWVKENVSEKNLELRIHPPIIAGRGPTLKCPEKKVSRNHATIDWDDDGILITSTHMNPTFLIINGKEQTLTKGNSAVLREGDKFGLLKETFWYKLCMNSSAKACGKEIRPSPNGVAVQLVEDNLDDSKGEAEEVKVPAASATKEAETRSETTPAFRDELVHCPNPPNPVPGKIEGQREPLISLPLPGAKEKQQQNDIYTTTKATSHCGNRERDLPKWLRTCDGEKSVQPDDCSGKAKAKLHGKAQRQTPSKAPRKVEPRLNPRASEEEKERRPQGSNKKKSPKKTSPTKKASHYHTVSQDFDLPAGDGDADESKRHLISDDDEDEPSPVKPTNATSNAEVVAPTKKTPSSYNVQQSKQPNQSPRKSCDYGQQCYRQNPNHRRTVAHPGDADYASPPASSSDDDDREECEFGLDCYRRNPQHKKTHKHTRKPQPQRHAKREGKRRRAEAGDISDDSYDLEDPFLNDDSSGDDYAPTDASDSDTDVGGAVDDEDDTKRMMKEAGKFVKKRRRK